MSTLAEMSARLVGVFLCHGAGSKIDDGMCAMQAVAWLAGEVDGNGYATDKPACACPVIGHFVITSNDRWFETDRQKLVAIVPLLVGSRATRAVEIARGYHFEDFAVRTVLPWLCDRLKRPGAAARLRALGNVTDQASAKLARREALSVRDICAVSVNAAAAAYTYAIAVSADTDRSQLADLCIEAIRGALAITAKGRSA